MGSHVTRVMGFLPANFQPRMPFHSRLTVKHVTDRQTDRRRPSMHNAPNLWEWGRHQKGECFETHCI